MSGSNALNPSIPLQAGQGVTPIPNPLTTMGTMMQLRQMQQQNALFPGQQQIQGQTITSNNLANQNAALALQQAQNRAVYAGYGPLLSDPNPTMGKIIDALASQQANGIDTSQAIADLHENADPTNLAGYVRSRFATTQLSGPEQVAISVGVPGSQDRGGQIVTGLTTGALSPGKGGFQASATAPTAPGPQFVQTGGANVPTSGGVPTGAPSIPNAPSPSEMNGLQQVWNPTTKQFEYKPRLAVAPMVNGAGSPVGGAPVTTVPGLPTTGRITPPVAAPQSAASAPLGVPQEADLSVQHAGAARDRANNYQQTIQPIEGALNALQGADTGRASELLNSIRANVQDIAPNMIQRMMPDSITDPAKRQDYEMAAKYLTGMAVNSPGGARSNEGQAAAMSANPSTHISNAAATHVAEAILAQQRMQQAGTLSFNNSGQPASEYDRYMNQWTTNQDPRAYIVDKMAPADRAALVAGMGGTKSAAYQKFRQSYQQGVDTGVVPGHGAN